MIYSLELIVKEGKNMPVKRELILPGLQGGGPLAEEAVTLYEQLTKPGSNFPDFYPAFALLGEELLQHAQIRTARINRDAFLQEREGVRVIDVLG